MQHNDPLFLRKMCCAFFLFWKFPPIWEIYVYLKGIPLKVYSSSSSLDFPSGIYTQHIQTTWKEEEEIESHYWHLLFFLVYNNN